MKLVNPPQEVKTQELDASTLMLLQKRMNDLLDQDWQDAEAGVYPKESLFDNPWADFFRFYPMVCLDVPSIWERFNNRVYHQFDTSIDTSDYPKYYLQNFHYQKDGYLSEMSANLYDLQVEILFNGTADAMRRRILAPLKAGSGPNGGRATRKNPRYRLRYRAYPEYDSRYVAQSLSLRC